MQPKSAVTVKLPCPEDYAGENCRVYRVEKDGSLTDMNAVYNGKYLVFQTKHFSTYLITETELKTEKVMLGDVNGDNIINIKDSALIRRYVAGWDVEFK